MRSRTLREATGPASIVVGLVLLGYLACCAIEGRWL